MLNLFRILTWVRLLQARWVIYQYLDLKFKSREKYLGVESIIWTQYILFLYFIFIFLTKQQIKNVYKYDYICIYLYIYKINSFFLFQKINKT